MATFEQKLKRLPPHPVTLRLERGVVERLDALAGTIALPGQDPRRTDAIRAVIARGLTLLEARQIVPNRPRASGR